MTVEPMADAELAEVRHWHASQGLSFEPPNNDVFDRLFARLNAERSRADAAEAARSEQHDIVSRIWKHLGSPSYEDLGGRSIYDMIDEIIAARDAALARAMPEWRYLATWDEVNTVEARHNDEPAPGLYVVWKPGWPYPSAASVQFGVFATDEESPAPDDYLLGAWVVGPLSLPSLPIPPTEETPDAG